MKTKTVVFFRCVLSVALIFVNFFVYAGNETFNARRSGTAITQNLIVAVKDAQYDYMVANPSTWSNSFDNRVVKNQVTLAVDQYSLKQTVAYTASVELQITYQIWAGVSFQPITQTQNTTLTVNYDPNAQYNDKAVYTFTGGNLLSVKIVSIGNNSNSSVATNTLPVYLETEIEIERHYNFAIATGPALVVNQTAIDGKVLVHWNYLPGAEEYQLEWTYVNNYSGDGTAMLSPSVVTFEPNIFSHNSTRISTTNNYYNVPIVYEQGYLLFRVRGVGLSKPDHYNKNLFSAWSEATENYTHVTNFNGTSVYQILNGHRSGMNWQYNISYAEQGKNKAVVSYFDGSLRNRQAVTLMNTQNQSIVGETIYDYQGRPAIQVLPVPQEDAVLDYKPNLNLNPTLQPYSKKDFDLDNGDCVVKAKPMDFSGNVSNGASVYYSTNNMEVPQGTNFNPFAAYVPSANGYPFTQTQYTPDNTGRLKAQTGVGDQHQLGTNHETKYFYGKPTAQEELDRMFGSEVGNVVHYKKNMVIDANGQISVSYIDPQGRVIATALAGAVPADAQNNPIVDALPSAASSTKTITAHILNEANPQQSDSIQQVYSNTSKSYSQEMLVSTAGVRNFHYKVQPTKFQDMCNEAGLIKTLCYNCVLDLSIVLTDECNNNYLVKLDGVTDQSTTTTVGSQILAQINQGNYIPVDCSVDPPAFETTGGYNSSPLPVGKYTLSKVLTVNQVALDFYTEDYIKNNVCLLTIKDFITDEMSRIDTTGCALTCEKCLDNLGTYDQYDIDINPNCNPCLTEGEYNQEKANCDKLCDQASVTCENALQMLLNDVSLLGQYGLLYDADNTTLDLAIHDLSVFDENNILPIKLEYRNNVTLNSVGREPFRPTWRHPIYKDANGVIRSGYLNQDGSPSLIKVLPLDDNIPAQNYKPAINPGVQTILIDGDEFVNPEDLKNIADFIVNWQQQWSQSLVMHHPEYKQYEFCIMEEPSHDFDEKWITINSILPPAQYPGYLNPLGADMQHAIDPYFNSSQNPNIANLEYTYMQDAMNHYSTASDGTSLSIWQMAYQTVHCPYNTTSSAVGSCHFLPCYAGITSTSTDKFDDNTWQTFRSMYYSLKQRVYNQTQTIYSILNNSYGGCIGDQYFTGWEDNFAYYPDYTPNSAYTSIGFGWDWFHTQFFNPQQACSYWFYRSYSGKIKRFLNGAESPQNSAINSTVCYDDQTNGTYQKIDCPLQNQAISDDLNDQEAFSFYQMCGECPIVKSAEKLFDGIAENKTYNLTSPHFQLSCYPTSQFPQFTQDLEVALNLSGTGEVFWNRQSVSATNLQVNIARDGGGSCTFNFGMQPTYPILDNSTSQYVNKSFAWTDIQSICCMSTLSTPTLFAPNPGYNFTLSATVNVTDADGAKRVDKISIEGVSTCFNLNACTPPVLCQTTDSAAVLASLINHLLYTSPAVTTGQVTLPALTEKLTSTNDVIISPQNAPYDAAFITDLSTASNMAATEFVWNASTSGNMLTGILHGVSGNTETGSCMIELSFASTVVLPAGVSFSNIQQINTLRPDKTNANPSHTVDPAHNFTCYALITYQVGDVLKHEYVLMNGYSPCIQVGRCETAQKPGNSTN